MKFSHLCIISLGALMLFGCTNKKYSSPVLIERGVGQNEYEREYFISKESMGIDKHLQNTFKQGYVTGDWTSTSPPRSKKNPTEPSRLSWQQAPSLRGFFQVRYYAV